MALSKITADSIAANAVSATMIADGSITNAKLGTDIDASKITTGTIPTARIADAAITSAKMSPGAAGTLSWVALNNSLAGSVWAKVCTISGGQNDRGSILLSGSSSFSAGADAISGGATIYYTVGNDAVTNNLNLQIINSSSVYSLVTACYVVKGATDFIWDVWVQVGSYARVNAFAIGNIYTITNTYTDVSQSTKPTGGYDKAVGRAVTSLTPGAVLQVAQGVKTDTAIVSGGATYTIATVSITPSSTTSKILLSMHVNGYSPYDATLYFTRNGTPIGLGDAAGSRARGVTEMNGSPRVNEAGNNSGFFLDSPSTTSAITYAIVVYNASATSFINRSGSDTDAGYDARTISTITAMEISA